MVINMDYMMTMTHINIHHAKAHLSEHLQRVAEGEVIVLCKRNVPIAEIRRIDPPPEQPRPLGIGREMYPGWVLPPSFFDPLPDDLLSLFEGREPERDRP